MDKREQEIQRKLTELEASIDEPPQQLSSSPASTELKEQAVDTTSSDLHLVLGACLILTGFFMVLHHVQVGTGFFSWFGLGSHGFGFILLPLMIGLGMLFYDYKLRWGWIVTGASCALLLFAVLSQLVLTFPSMSLLGVVTMFLPFAAGGAFIARGLSARKGKS